MLTGAKAAGRCQENFDLPFTSFRHFSTPALLLLLLLSPPLLLLQQQQQRLSDFEVGVTVVLELVDWLIDRLIGQLVGDLRSQ